MHHRLFPLLSWLFLAFSVPVLAQHPPNVILLIGDGMGVAQVSSAFYFGEGTPHFQRFTKIGLVKTNSVSNKVTDSAGAATAIATGVRSYNRAISVSPDTVSVPTILEQLRDDYGYRTGLVSLTSITHATPACFYAHVADRDEHHEIAAQLIGSGVDFFAGGGLDYFTRRADGRDLYRELASQGYRLDSLELSPADPSRKNGYLLAPESLPSKVEGRGDFLPDAARMGLDYFTRQEAPFFFMVEGSYIDWAGHAENDTMLIREVADFDKTLGILLDYVEAHPNTLLVVTADHETGGVSLAKKYHPQVVFGQKKEIPAEVAVSFNSNQHSAELVPIFAKGKGEDLFPGIYQNNEIFTRLLRVVRSEQ
ncbi:alkaline phosphatase [Lewinella sp. IMCC34191]|uniref:alkaline phosphatase n=1 Tax=Lewinella sp. IMCC34191 TaxID=2259172 RepID=UPI000E26847B|nr:alkaline phosphatase [Lewinella sp. IMCC34191]